MSDQCLGLALQYARSELRVQKITSRAQLGGRCGRGRKTKLLGNRERAGGRDKEVNAQRCNRSEQELKNKTAEAKRTAQHEAYQVDTCCRDNSGLIVRSRGEGKRNQAGKTFRVSLARQVLPTSLSRSLCLGLRQAGILNRCPLWGVEPEIMNSIT
jgi:hypothetical protein